VEPAKDHEIAALVNQLTSIAKEFHSHQSLRERVAQLVRPWAQPSQARESMDHEQKAEIVSNWFSDEDMQSRALQMLGDYERAIAAINAKGAQ
jgi:hypothetical protein